MLVSFDVTLGMHLLRARRSGFQSQLFSKFLSFCEPQLPHWENKRIGLDIPQLPLSYFFFSFVIFFQTSSSSEQRVYLQTAPSPRNIWNLSLGSSSVTWDRFLITHGPSVLKSTWIYSNSSCLPHFIDLAISTMNQVYHEGGWEEYYSLKSKPISDYIFWFFSFKRITIYSKKLKLIRKMKLNMTLRG